MEKTRDKKYNKTNLATLYALMFKQDRWTPRNKCVECDLVLDLLFFHPSHFARFFVWIGNSIENCNHNKLRIARHGLSRQKKSTIFVSLKSEHTHKCFIFYILNSPFTTVPRLWLNFTQFVEIIMHKNPKKNENQIFRTFNDLAKWLHILSRSSGVKTLLNA